MNILLILIILMHNEMPINFAFASSNTLLHAMKGYNRLRRNSPLGSNRFPSTPGYHSNSSPTEPSNLLLDINKFLSIPDYHSNSSPTQPSDLILGTNKFLSMPGYHSNSSPTQPSDLILGTNKFLSMPGYHSNSSPTQPSDLLLATNKFLLLPGYHSNSSPTQPSNPPSGTNKFLSIPGYRSNSSPTQPSSSLVCPSNPSSYPLKSIIVSNIGSASGATLSTPDHPNSITNTATARGSLLIFNNPPMSQCYLLNFSSKTSSFNPIDMNNMKVQFIYDSSNAGGEPTRSIVSNNGYGGSSVPYPSNTFTACGSVICQNGGVCRSMGANGYQCQCDSSGQWLGNDCSKHNPCTFSPCQNGGQCYYLPDATYYCVCYSGYSGNNCQDSAMATAIPGASSYNPCSSVRPCLNGGTCLSQGNQAFTCMCPQGYTGVNCQSLNSVVPAPSASSNTCGVSPLPQVSTDLQRIVGGEPVKDYTWPWIVSLQTMNGGQHFCGGTLIDAFHVVTAAHCFDAAGTTPSMFKVVAGILNLRQTNSPHVQQFAIERIFRHEQYSSTALVNDITLLKLRTAAQINEAVHPICLPDPNGSQDPKVGQSVRIAGWGYTSSVTKQVADQLQQATIQILDINGDLYGGPGCNAWIRRGYTLDNAKQICAMSRDTRADSCQGDSGGPLIYDVKSQWYLEGIVSYGDAVCASGTAAGVYTRVSAYVPWIRQKLLLK